VASTGIFIAPHCDTNSPVRTDIISGFVLAGGKSTRMGEDKAFLPFGKAHLIDRALEQVRSVAQEIYVVGPRDRFAAYGRSVQDQFAGAGPLAGIHAALSRTTTEVNLMLAVDTPLVEEPFLRFLIQQAAAGGTLVTVPQSSDGLHPLCAVYRPGFAQLAEDALKNNRFKIDALFSPAITRIIALDELTAAGYSSAMFANLNTPEEYQRARAGESA
jgi:molybdopterin-guanine dinucleotide biosynthesis protein A